MSRPRIVSAAERAKLSDAHKIRYDVAHFWYDYYILAISSGQSHSVSHKGTLVLSLLVSQYDFNFDSL